MYLSIQLTTLDGSNFLYIQWLGQNKASWNSWVKFEGLCEKDDWQKEEV